MTSCSGSARRLLERHCAVREREIRPALSSTLRWREIAGWLMENGAASSETVASPSARRARIALLVGSASAEKIPLSLSSCANITNRLYKAFVIHDGCRRRQERRRAPLSERPHP